MNDIKISILKRMAKQIDESYPYYCRLIELEKNFYQDSDEFKKVLAEYKKIMNRCNALFTEEDFVPEDIAMLVFEDDEDNKNGDKYILEHFTKYFAILPIHPFVEEVVAHGKAETPSNQKIITNYLNLLDADIAINILLASARQVEAGEINYHSFIDFKYHYLFYSRMVELFLLEHGLVINEGDKMPSHAFFEQQSDAIKSILTCYATPYLINQSYLLIININRNLTENDGGSISTYDTLVEGNVRSLDNASLETLEKNILESHFINETSKLFLRKIELVKKQRVAKLDKPES